MRKPLSISQEEMNSVAEHQVKKAEAQAVSSSSTAPAGSSSGGGLSKALQAGNNVKKNAPLANSAANVKWTVPVLEYGFNLDAAKEKAYTYAQHYMNDMLTRDDMELVLDVTDTGDVVGHVNDKSDGRLINTYQGVDMLKVYAQNNKERGVIVDGRV